eukprot:4639970-Alexandrium_andersonii.AAC.1
MEDGRLEASDPDETEYESGVQGILEEHPRSDEDVVEDMRGQAEALGVSKEPEARGESEERHAPEAH